MAAETKRSETIKRGEDKFLWVLIGIPIIILIIAAGGPALWKGLKTVLSIVVPNFWVFIGYCYIAFVAFVIGRRLR